LDSNSNGQRGHSNSIRRLTPVPVDAPQ
jgi:hypothetical protein